MGSPLLQSKRFLALASLTFFVAFSAADGRAAPPPGELPELIREARDPGPLYRPVPLWWWDGDKLEIERLRWQLDELHKKGVDQVCLIYLAPLRSDPPYFTEDWWKLYEEMADYAAGLGMKVWLTDGIAWGSPFINNSVLEEDPDFRGQLLEQQEKTVSGAGRVLHEIPQGYEVTDILGAYAYRTTPEGIDVGERRDLSSLLDGRTLAWDAPAGEWRVMIFYTKPMGFQGNMELGFGRGYGIDYANPAAMETLIGLTTGEYADRVGEHMGGTIPGTFQDELVTHHHYGFPPYPKRFTAEFEKRKGYDLRPLLGALYHDAGKRTSKVRCDYFEVLVELYEEAFYKPYFQWHEERGMMVAHDQFGRMDLIDQTWGYGDYFRTQSWFQAPGYDDWNQAVPGRNWKDAKLASSIAQLYGRSRVWVEALHSSGWGLDLQEQVLTLNENYIYGANIYDKHGFDYSTYGSWYNWAPPSAHYRMPYWMHYRPFADYVTRMSYLQSQGDYVADAGVFYPVHTIQANYSAGTGANKLAALTETYFWDAGRHLLDSRIDFHFVNDQSIQRGAAAGGRLQLNGVELSTLVLPPLTTIDRETLNRVEEFVENGGLLISLARAPGGSTQQGRDDPEVLAAMERIFGAARPAVRIEKNHPNGGLAVFLPDGVEEIEKTIRAHRTVDVETDAQALMYHHRRAGGLDLYMFYNRSAKDLSAAVRVRAAGTPYRFDSRTGEVEPLYVRSRKGEFTRLKLDFGPYEAYHVYFERGEPASAVAETNLDEVEKVSEGPGALLVEGWHQSSGTVEVEDRAGERSSLKVSVAGPLEISGAWEFELKPTMDNRWGDFRRPPSDEMIGPEIRRFRYRPEPPTQDGAALGWHERGLEDSDWPAYTASVGPHWWVLGPVPNRGAEGVLPLKFGPEEGVDPERTYRILGREYRWRPYSFSTQFGHEKDPDYFRGLGSKNKADPTFLELGHADHFGLVYLFTHVYSPRATEALLVSSTSGYWETHVVRVNGKRVSDRYHRDTSQQFGGLIRVSLQKGWNTLFIKTNQRSSPTKFNIYLIDQQRALERGAQTSSEGPPRLPQFADAGFVYDIYGGGETRVGWYRFALPPGTSALRAKIEGDARFFINGEERRYDSAARTVKLAEPLKEAGLAAIRVEHEPGKYAGAAIPEPIRLETGTGRIQLGDWSKQGLLSYSGAAVYRKSLRLPEDFSGKKLILDLGKVDASASVRVNGQEVGVRGWAPYRFDITEAVQPGSNEVEVTVANALGNHYLAGTPSVHVYEGQTESGLFGPVRVVPYTRVKWTIAPEED